MVFPLANITIQAAATGCKVLLPLLLYIERYDKAKEKHDELSYKIEQKKAHSEKMKLFIKALKDRDEVITEFDDALWGSLVDFITVGKKERTATFNDGTVVGV